MQLTLEAVLKRIVGSDRRRVRKAVYRHKHFSNTENYLLHIHAGGWVKNAGGARSRKQKAVREPQ
jgi:hypothetical protein